MSTTILKSSTFSSESPAVP